jgi:hypothetical protein
MDSRLKRTIIYRMTHNLRAGRYAFLVPLLALVIPPQIPNINPSPGPDYYFLLFFENNYLLFLFLAVGVECFVVFTARGIGTIDDELSPGRILLTVASVNLITFSILWLSVRNTSYSLAWDCLFGIPMLEILVVAAEAAVYKTFLRLSTRKALLLSVSANLASFFAGWIISAMFAEKPEPFDYDLWS